MPMLEFKKAWNMLKSIIACIILLTFMCCYFKLNDVSKIVQKNESRILSRSKRYLVFPEGSSLQLVFCVQTSAVIPIGDIFLFGNTAALAWSLPTDPEHLIMLKQSNSSRRRDSGRSFRQDSYSRLRSAVPSPMLAKRSVDENMSFKEKLKFKTHRAKMHEENTKRNFLKNQNLDYESTEFHRSSRVRLYEKLVPLITALGSDGRQCVLYKLCESAKESAQGTFLQEFLRIIFTLPKGTDFEEEYREYDTAHTTSNYCDILYPGCNFNLSTNVNSK